ncbi:MAG: quinol:electron acceptor oxidoreductase subunit ActD [Hymenobacter sp.]
MLLHAVDNVRAAGVKIYDVFSPYPVHGIDDALGIERSRLPIAAFFYGHVWLVLRAVDADIYAGFRLADDYWG